MDKIVCFGKNYQDHMLELGDAPVSKPVIFLKPPSVLIQCNNWNDRLQVVHTGTETHYETELVVKLGKGGYRMTAEDAKNTIVAYTIGLEMTYRKEQAQLKKDGHPWTVGKVFPDAAIIGPWIECDNLDFLDIEFKFTLDGKLKQKSPGRMMLFSPTDLIVYASSFFPLCAGDVLFTGTPSGVGAISENSVGVLELGEEHQYSVEWQPIPV